MQVFSDRRRPVHLGPFPLETLSRGGMPDLSAVPLTAGMRFEDRDNPSSLINAMAEHQAMMDAIRDGMVNKARAEIPEALGERSNHLKSFGYFSDASMVGIGPVMPEAVLDQPIRNPDIDRLAQELQTRQTKTLASGIDVIMADLRDSMQAPPTTIVGHAHAIVFLYEMPRDVRADEPGSDWIIGAERHRAAMRATETAVVIANYIRLLGWDAKAHTASSSDICLNRLAVAAGLLRFGAGGLEAPFLGTRFGLAAITTEMPLAHDAPLGPGPDAGAVWWSGARSRRSAWNRDPYERRDYVDGPHPFETLRRVEDPTTYIDEPRVARVPKRTDMFARAQFGDMGKAPQKAAAGGYYARKSAPSMAQRRALGAFVLLQDGPEEGQARPLDGARNAACVKAASYFLGIDAAGISRCPDWAWYSHDAIGAVIEPDQPNAISMIVDQGFETMEGSSGDDWIAVAQSMRAYLRFSLLGGVIAKQIRRLGYKAKAHTVLDGEVLQPPLLLLSGLGEVSRIGEVILNPFLGPRLKSGVVTTDMPLTHDKPIDFGLQAFCEACNKCARECPSGAITAGPKLMFNGYEIWKSDSQKCATYRVTTEGGAMCGRCMKTCPWNLEGLFAEKPFRWAAMNFPGAAKHLARLDDAVGRGSLNPVKKWWWDIELYEDGAYRPVRKPVNARGLQPGLDLRYEDQTLAVYPANLAPHPWPYPFPMNREAGIEAYQGMVTAETHKAQLLAGNTDHVHGYRETGDSPVIQVQVSLVEPMGHGVTKFEFQALDGRELPEWSAGAHLDVVVAPEFLRQYSMSGDPADRSRYQIAVLKEEDGRGGSKLLHRIFTPGRKVFISKPINHFPLEEGAARSLLFGGGIGVTPMIAMGHRLASLGAEFTLHYSVGRRENAGFLSDLEGFSWADCVKVHISAEDTRAEFAQILGNFEPGTHVYLCGPEPYMTALSNAAQRAGYPEENVHSEYFAIPEMPEYENHSFKICLKSGEIHEVSPNQSVAEVLNEIGHSIDIKCSDGLCGVCKCGLLEGKIEHRDFVLSNKQRESEIITCQSRAAEKDGIIYLDL